MTYFDDEKTRKKKGAALLLLMHLREHDEQLLQGTRRHCEGFT
jgi:hypothetical protein